MNANDLVTMLRDPEFLHRPENKLLEKFVEKHPYFFIAHALLAKKNSSDQKHSKQSLHAAALQAGDREMLHHFMKEKPGYEEPPENAKEKIAVPLKQKELTVAEMDNEELMEMLKSIHERKVAFLNSGGLSKREEVVEEEKVNAESEIDASEQFELSEASIADSEFSMNNILLEEESEQNAEELSSEIESMHELDSEMSEQAEFDLQEDLLLTNEISGGGAEFIPTDFLNSEDAIEDFTLEPDAEIQSMNVIEEEIIFHDSEYELREVEAKVISAFETPLQTESENTVPFITEDISYEEVETLQVSKEIPEQSFDEKELEEEKARPVAGDSEENSSLRINEHVSSPGEFLPDKSYTYSQWLHFFRYDSPGTNMESVETTDKKESPRVQEAERSFGATMQLELESIDRIVSSIKMKPEEGAKKISPEELAGKSLELNEDVVSETLAQIYEEQGRYDKAIRQYVKLSLIYPEKVSFFAARIKELKGKK
ncbi:MAG TPA: hypothetical protein VE978_12990 [Chitinophagales bacterium]|nr:hypothetical protein [Chitinophagales bacterium]